MTTDSPERVSEVERCPAHEFASDDSYCSNPERCACEIVVRASDYAELEQLLHNATSQEFHNVDDVVTIAKLREELAEAREHLKEAQHRVRWLMQCFPVSDAAADHFELELARWDNWLSAHPSEPKGE